MLRKITLSLFLVVGMAFPAMAQPLDAVAEDHTFAEAVRNYHQQLPLRSDVSAHNQTVRGILNEFDGRVIVEKFFSGDFYMMVWDAGMENVVMLRNGEEIPLDTYTDEHGRPAFESDYGSGWLDVFGNELHLQVSVVGEAAHRWLGELPSEGGGDDDTAPLVAPASDKVCTCGGTREKEHCQENMNKGCTDQDSCTLSGGAQMRCKWREAYEEPPPPDRCGCVGAPGMATFPALGIVMLFGPVRRRVIRRVRRSR